MLIAFIYIGFSIIFSIILFAIMLFMHNLKEKRKNKKDDRDKMDGVYYNDDF